MAYLVFAGDAAVYVRGTADDVAAMLVNDMGVAFAGFVEVDSHEATVRVNPRQVAYIVDDDAYRDRQGGPNSAAF